MKAIQELWRQSRLFRVVLVLALFYGVLRLAAQIWLISARMLPGQSETQIAPTDLQIYIEASTRLESRRPLYPPDPQQHEVYQYPPLFALLFLPFLWLLRLSGDAFLWIQFLIRLVAYVALIFKWEHIFSRLQLDRAVRMWAWSLPLWIVFSSFWGDLAYFNIYLLIALGATLLLEAVLFEKVGLSVFFLTLLIQIKPQWAFAVVVPLLLGRHRFFIRLCVWGMIANLIAVALFLILTGPSYGLQQYVQYFPYATSLKNSLPWRGPDAGFIGYNHSITQIVVFLMGITEGSFRWASWIKILLLCPLGILCVRQAIYANGEPALKNPYLALDLAFSCYLGVFLWMDWVWELALACAIFAYLLSDGIQKPWVRLWIGTVFVLYAMVDFWQLLSYLLFGEKIITPDEYLLTDYSIYVPIIMVVLLTFYSIFIERLWRHKSIFQKG